MAQQKISLSSSDLSVIAGGKLNFDVIYNTDPVGNSTGLSLRLHFNSQDLTFDSADNFFESNSDVRSAPAVNDDTDDFDSDPSTDKFLLASWASFTGNWPGDDNATDTVLYSPNFTAVDSFDGTTLNFTAAETAAGFDLDASSVTVDLLVLEPPVIDETTATITLDENTAANTEIGTISASDPDGDGATVRFTISDNTNIDTDSDDEPAFAISEAGAITINDAEEIDFETNQSFTFEVTATDTDDLTDTATVTVNLTNIDEAPIVANALEDISVDEDSDPKVIDLSDVFSDPDGDTVSPRGSTSNKDLVTLTREDNELTLNFVPNATGTAEITVTGTANGLSAEDTFTVTVDGSNSPDAPIIDESTFTFDVAENSAVGTEVGMVKASDPDAGDTLSYSFSSDSNPDRDGDGARAFAISNTGTITVADSKELNFETNPQFELDVTVTDTTDLTATTKVMVNLSNVSGVQQNSTTAGVFNFDADSNLAFDLVSNDDNPLSVSQVNEIGIFLFDDATGKIGELNPGDPGYDEAALERSRSLFTILSSLPTGFNGNTQQILDASDLFNVDGENLFGLYLTPDNGESIFLSNSEGNVTIEENQDDGGFTINWADLGEDFSDIALSVNPTEINSHLGTDRLLDFSDATENQTVKIDITRAADFNNAVGWYEIDDLTGAITGADGNTIAPTADNAAEYVAAARDNLFKDPTSDTPLTFAVGNGEKFTSEEIELEAGKTYAPIILVEGAENPTEIYTPFASSNSDGVNRVISLGDNAIGFEDWNDFDYNDMVIEFEFI